MKPTKPKQHKNKISLRFMDLAVTLEGKNASEKKALSLMAALLQDRLKIFELLDNLEDSDNVEEDITPSTSRNKHIKFDSMFQ